MFNNLTLKLKPGIMIYKILYVTLLFSWASISSDLEIQKTYTIDEGLPANDARAIYIDSEGSKWVGTSSGAARLTGDIWVKEIIKDQPVTTIFEDAKHNMWFGGIGEVNRYDGKELKRFSMKNDMQLEGRLVFSVTEDDTGNIWVATTGGAAMFDGISWSPMTIAKGLKHNVVHDVKNDDKGRIWFATRKGGVNIYDGASWKYVYPDKNCRKILRDKNDNMWVGTSSGLLLFDGENWHALENGKTMLPMFEGKKGYIWCVSNGMDIVRVSPDINNKRYHYKNPTAGQDVEIYDLGTDKDGAVWAGTIQGISVLH